MADLSITAAAVASGTNAIVDHSYNAGATITAGESVYLGPSNTWLLSTGAGTIAQAATRGISLHASLAGQPLAVQTGGPITIAHTVVAGTTYYTSINNPGGVMTGADFTTGNYITVLGIAISTTVLQLGVNPLGITHA